MAEAFASLKFLIEHFWNDWGSTRYDLLLIICGSPTSWMTHKIIRNHGGLHNKAIHMTRRHGYIRWGNRQ